LRGQSSYLWNDFPCWCTISIWALSTICQNLRLLEQHLGFLNNWLRPNKPHWLLRIIYFCIVYCLGSEMVFHNQASQPRKREPGLANWPAVIRNRQPQNPNFYGQVSLGQRGAEDRRSSIISWAIEVIKITTKCSKFSSFAARWPINSHHIQQWPRKCGGTRKIFRNALK